MDVSVGVVVMECFLEGFDEVLVGGVVLGIFGDLKNMFDYLDGFFLELVMVDVVK